MRDRTPLRLGTAEPVIFATSDKKNGLVIHDEQCPSHSLTLTELALESQLASVTFALLKLPQHILHAQERRAAEQGLQASRKTPRVEG